MRARTASGDVVPRVDSDVRDAEAPCDAGDRGFALLVHQPCEPGRGEDQRHRRRAAEDRRREIDRRDVAQHARDELDPGERFARAPQARLGLGGPVGVVEDGPRNVPAGDVPEVRRWSRPRRGAARPAPGGSDRSAGTAGPRTGGGVGDASSDAHGGSIPDAPGPLRGTRRRRAPRSGLDRLVERLRELGLVEVRVGALAREQPVVRPLLDDVAGLHHQDHVGVADR